MLGTMISEKALGELVAATNHMDDKLDNSMKRKEFWKILIEICTQMGRVQDNKQGGMGQLIRIVLRDLTNPLLQKLLELYLGLGAGLLA